MVNDKSQYNYDAVNLQYVACAICPEVWKVRKPTSNAEKTALASGSVKFSVRTNAAGNAGIYVFL